MAQLGASQMRSEQSCDDDLRARVKSLRLKGPPINSEGGGGGDAGILVPKQIFRLNGA